jgi:uncharacterized protein YndB with AHSA1/START domain
MNDGHGVGIAVGVGVGVGLGAAIGLGVAIKTEPFVISRVFAAPRDLVFKAWSTVDHMKRWFSPEHYNVPEAEIDFRPGGVFAVRLRSEAGQDCTWRGKFIEVSPHDRLVFTSLVSFDGSAKITVDTEVTFEEEGGGTRMTVRQEGVIHDETFPGTEGAAEGWRTTLDKLEKELSRMQVAQNRSVAHGVFTIERVYDAAPARVFHALSNKEAKARWFTGGDNYTLLEREMDVRPGGRETLKGRWASGMVTQFEATYFDVVPNERLVYAYEMHLDNRKISVSLATLELKPVGKGTRLVVTEQGAFLDGYDDAGSREHGTGELLNRLGESLKA